jgi:large repetitive protein
LPPGLTFDANSGLLSGSPSAAGTYPGLSIGVTDVGGLTATSAVFSIEVDPALSSLTISWAPNLTYTDGDNIYTALTVAGGTGNYHFSYSGTLPAEVSQNGDDAGPYSGALVGVMTPPGTYGPITVTVSDGVSTATTTPATFVVNPAVVPAISVAGPYVPGSGDTSTQPGAPLAGANYAGQFAASGGNGGPYAYSLVLGSDKLPPGLALNQSTGLISGTVNLSAGSNYYGPIQVRATDSAGNFGLSASFSIYVQPTLSIDVSTRQAGREGVPFQSYYRANDGTTYGNYPPGVSGGDGNYTWSISGTLPNGLGIDVGGNLVGTPAAGTAGSYPGLVYTVQDGTGATVSSNSFTLLIEQAPPPPPIVVSHTSFPSPYQVGQYFLTNLSATGGDGGPYTFAVQGPLPAGFTFDGQGLAATAAPSNVGTWTFNATATDSHGNVGSTSFQVEFDYMPLQLNGGATISVNVGDNIQSVLSAAQYTFHATGGSGGYTFATTSGSLPPGLALGGADSSNVYLSGSVGASASGLYSNIVVQVTDSVGNTATSNPFSIFVNSAGPLTIAGNPPTVAYVSQLYQTQFFASGGSGSGYVFTGINFPGPNLRIDASSGVVQGSLIPGTYPNLQVQVADSAGNTALSQPWTLTVPNALSLSIPSPIKGKIGQPIDPVQAIASGGAGSGYKYAMWDFSPALPAGLTFNATTGQITGTPQETASNSNYRGQVTDSATNFATSNYFEIDIQAPLVFAGTPDPDAYVGYDYAASVPKASGGDGMPWAFTYASIGASLPPGLTMNSRGLIGGTPTTAGVYAGIQLQVTDSSGNTASSAVFSITVHGQSTTAPVVAWFETNGFANGSPVAQPGNQYSIQTIATGVNTPVTVQVAAAGGKSHTYTFSITPGFEGTNMSVSSSGQFTATFQTGGTYRVSVRATDPVSGMYGDTPPLVIQVTDLAISAGPDLSVPGGQSIFIPVTTSGGTAPYRYRKGGGELPAGVYIDPATGNVMGGLAGLGQGGVYQFSVFVTDANGLTADTGVVSIGVMGAMGCMLVGVGPWGVVGAGPATVGVGIEPSPNYPDYYGLAPNASIEQQPVTGPGYYSFRIRAGWIDIPYDKANCLDSYINVRYVEALNLFTPGLRYGVAGGSFTYQLQASGGGGYNWYTASQLPSGLHIDHDSGLISGVVAPTAAGSYDVIVTAMDQYGEFVQDVLQIAVAPGY